MKNLDIQVFMYSVETSSFYNEVEHNIHSQLMSLYNKKNKLDIDGPDYKECKKEVNSDINVLKNELRESFRHHEGIRHLRHDALRESNIIAIFDSVLTRTLNINKETVTKDIIVVHAYYFEILEDIIKNGFMLDDEKYIYFSSSAGQIRTKKAVFIKESLWNMHKETLMCGLTVDSINKQGGINTNKYQAYLALSNSASVEWKFDIHRAIVVDDLETNVHSLVDFIDKDTYEITRQQMSIPVEHTDGCGMILPRKSKKSFMVRLPWIKGLLVPFPFDKFAEENNTFVVKDIYGVEHDIRNVDVIFTKSQFKMAKYYPSWADYQENFIKYNCKVAMLNEEDTTADAVLNYQMLQTLTDISDEELKQISDDTAQDILKVGSDKDTMLRVLGATETNQNKNSFQEALLIYPELLNDVHSKQVIKDKKKALVKDAKSGKLKIPGAKFTFLIPDLYAFCERLFLGISEPKGLLSNGEVYCSLYNAGKVDILRAPHLYREHAIKNNVINAEKVKWFITQGIYTSVHDAISKLLQFDNDGDKALVISDPLLVNIAERNMIKDDIVPLYYEMSKAPAQEINYDNIYNSLIAAYKANIGIISNNITKIWNSDRVDIDVIKWLVMENNFTIDFAKTLYKPTRPDHVDIVISQYTKAKVPQFFIHAKDKEVHNVEEINNSTVNRLEDIIPNKRINFKSVAGKFDFRMLMKNKRVPLDQEIIERYTHLDQNKHRLMKQLHSDDSKSNRQLYIYKFIRDELLKLNSNESYIVDVLVKYLYNEKKSSHKTTLWNSFGDVIVKNLKINIKGTMQCADCGERTEKKQAKKYCEKCAADRERKRVKKFRKKKVNGNKTA